MLKSDVAYQIMWNRLISVVEEQAQALIRTAFSTSVREAGDLSAGVYDQQGRMLAQAVTGTPGHVNAMADAVAHFIRRIGPDNIFEGDIYITNDPWEGTGHLHDITMVSPSFFNGNLVGFFACTAHVVDIGGRGFGADASSVYEEGLYLPILKFAERRVVDQTLIRIIRGNVRQPDQLIGDIYALASCNEIGHLEVRQVQGGLVDERRALQPRTHSPRRHRRQDGVPEEPRAAHAAVAQGRARAPAQLPQGRAVRHPGGGGRDIHDDRALARVEEVFSDSVPAVVVQARQEAPHPRARTAQGELFHLRAVKPGATRGARAHRAGVR